MGNLYTPNGDKIIGTADVIQATAICSGFQRDNDGRILPDYYGETEVDWDSQIQRREGSERLYVDEDGIEWLEKELEYREEPNESL